ncbi:MAG: hypothetical protein OHK0012_22480 [Synechococcales cyanobacterium]
MKSLIAVAALLVNGVLIVSAGCGQSPTTVALQSSTPSQTTVTSASDGTALGEAVAVDPSDLANAPWVSGDPNPLWQEEGDDRSTTNDDFVREVIRLTNLERRRRGIPPLQVNVALRKAALNHAKAMATKDFFSHTNPFNGSTPTSRAQNQGYNGVAGENIAAGYTTPAAVVQGWMNSSGHRANILNPNYQHLGVGYYYLANDTGSVNYRHYWVQVFGIPR